MTIHPFTHPTSNHYNERRIGASIRSFIHASIYPFTHASTHQFIHPSIHSCIHTHASSQPASQFIHSPTHSLTHPLKLKSLSIVHIQTQYTRILAHHHRRRRRLHYHHHHHQQGSEDGVYNGLFPFGTTRFSRFSSTEGCCCSCRRNDDLIK